jgi:transcriptional regulator with XRE-family HTH domain
MGVTRYIHPKMRNCHIRIKQLVDASGKTPAEIARGVGCSHTMIWQLAEGRTIPTCHTLIGLAEYFCVSADWILGITDDPAPAGLIGKYRAMGESYGKYLMYLQEKERKKVVNSLDAV